jgi:hypothetical protein
MGHLPYASLWPGKGEGSVGCPFGSRCPVGIGASFLASTVRREANVLEAYVAHRDTMVRVREDYRNIEVADMRGTIQEPWVTCAHGAVDVLLEDGSLRLFWLADLSVVDEDITV